MLKTIEVLVDILNLRRDNNHVTFLSDLAGYFLINVFWQASWRVRP